MLRHPNILLLSSDEQQAIGLRNVLSKHAILTAAADLGELSVLLQCSVYDALFCEWSFDRGTWNDALSAVQRFYPEMPVIVFSRTAGEEEWTKALDAGA